MAAVFLKLLNLSISASWLVLAVLVLRLISKRSPKWMNVLLWGIVALRLNGELYDMPAAEAGKCNELPILQGF